MQIVLLWGYLFFSTLALLHFIHKKFLEEYSLRVKIVVLALVGTATLFFNFKVIDIAREHMYLQNTVQLGIIEAHSPEIQPTELARGNK